MTEDESQFFDVIIGEMFALDGATAALTTYNRAPEAANDSVYGPDDAA